MWKLTIRYYAAFVDTRFSTHGIHVCFSTADMRSKPNSASFKRLKNSLRINVYISLAKRTEIKNINKSADDT